MTTTKRKMHKQPAGSVSCDGQPLTVIDAAAIRPKQVALRCQCGKAHRLDITQAVQQAIASVAVGALCLPDGDWRIVLNIGYTGAVLSAQVLRG